MDDQISFKCRQYQKELILLVLRWYLSYSLSYRDIEEMMLERGIHVDHSTINRWVIHHAPHVWFANKFNHYKDRSTIGTKGW